MKFQNSISKLQISTKIKFSKFQTVSTPEDVLSIEVLEIGNYLSFGICYLFI
jgi:hypothetical protein